MNTLSLAITKSFGLHLVVITLLFVSVDFHTPPKPQDLSLSTPIEAAVVDEAAIQQQLDKLEQQKRAAQQAEQQRLEALEKRARDAERRRREEEQRVADLAQERKRKEAEKRQAEQAAVEARKRQEQEREKARKLEEERKRKEQERKRAEEQARKAKEKKEAEERALREAERKRQEAFERAEQERILEEQLAAERAAQASRRRKQVLTEVQKYQVLITQTIQRNLIVDDSMKGKSCRINIRLASNGLVTKADVLSGDPILCRAAKAAVFKSDTLPVSPEPDVYEELKDINLTVEPEF